MAEQRTTAREKVLRAADRVFYERGIASTGINLLTDLAGVARMSLYKNFRSKDEVVLEYLERRHEQWKQLHGARVEAAQTRLERALCVPRSYIDRAELRGENFLGCGLLNAAGELPAHNPARQRVLEIKSRVAATFVEDLTQAGVPDAETVGEELFLLLEGGMVHAGLRADREYVLRVSAMVEQAIYERLM